jgi:hypothetical protein
MDEFWIVMTGLKPFYQKTKKLTLTNAAHNG